MDKWEIVVVKIESDADGLYTATSAQLAGVCVVHPDKDRVIEDLPNIVKLWFKRNRGIDVTAFVGPLRDIDSFSELPIAPIPAEIAAQALSR